MDRILSLSPAASYSFPNPDVIAYIDAVAEIVLPALLILGFATRFSDFGLLIMTAVTQLTVPPAG